MAKGRTERQHFIESQSETVDVAPRIRLAVELLRGHVTERSHQVAGNRQVIGLRQLGHAKIGNPDGLLLVDQQIGRFDVAMQRASAVCVLETLGDLEADSRNPPRVVRIAEPLRCRSVAGSGPAAHRQ